jgi:hypothetical protein
MSSGPVAPQRRALSRDCAGRPPWRALAAPPWLCLRKTIQRLRRRPARGCRRILPLFGRSRRSYMSPLPSAPYVRLPGCSPLRRGRFLAKAVFEPRASPAHLCGRLLAVTSELLRRRAARKRRLLELPVDDRGSMAWVRRLHCGRWATIWKIDVKPLSNPRRAARRYSRQTLIRSGPASDSARSACSSRLRAHSRSVRA